MERSDYNTPLYDETILNMYIHIFIHTHTHIYIYIKGPPATSLGKLFWVGCALEENQKAGLLLALGHGALRTSSTSSLLSLLIIVIIILLAIAIIIVVIKYQ